METAVPLRSRAGASEEVATPFRGELLGSDHLGELARDLAARWPVGENPGGQPLLHRLRDNERVLRRARDAAAEAAASREPITPDAEWLLDNFYIIEEVLREVRTDLPRGYYDELPVAAAGPWAGLPRVYALAVALVTHTDSHLEDAQVLRFVRAFQEVAPLTTGEVWAVPTVLRLALLENLRRLAAQMLLTRAERERATGWVERAAAGRATPLPDHPSDTFLVAWHTAVRDHGAVAPAAAQSGRYAGDLADVLRREHRRQAANQVSVGNCVTSLRLLNAVDWAAFFEQASLAEAALRAEPTGVYARQDFATRDRYRHGVETLAKTSGRDEVEVAREAIRRASAAATPREADVGYHLVAEGRKALARDLGCRPKLGERWRTFLTGHPHAVFFGGVASVTAAGVATVAAMAWSAGAAPAVVVLVALAAVLPASELAVAITNYAVCRLLPPRVLPKMDFSAGVPPEWRTVVVIPAMLFRSDSGDRLAERLELHHLANPDPELRFALLTDFADSPTEHAPDDEELVEAAVESVRRLNERHAAGGPDRFFLFHRRRLFNPAEGCWMGWERKRGKLEEFNRLLRGATDTSYEVKTGDAAALGARFVLTLDADTVLPRDAARRLVATLAHPLNRPVLSADGRRVAAGYGVLQPRVSFLYRTGLRSLFARVFAGSAGIDPYSSASSDVYQDLFGWGTFTGKGLYDVEAFDATAGRAFPDNHVLSHDLIESNFARCGLVTDAEVFDDFPAKYHAYTKREHRWIRGDWQLLPWLGPTVPTSEGRKPNVLTALGRWKVFDNLRRSLVPPALVVFLAVAWAFLPGPGWAWSLAALAVLAAPLVLQLLDALRGLLNGATAWGQLAETARGLGTTAAQVGLTATFLANQAYIAADAVVRTLYRLFVSRRQLLEWETAAAAEARLGTGLGQFAAAMWPAVAAGAALAGLVAWANPSALPAALPWLAAWAVSPLVAWWVSRPLPDRDPPLSESDRAELRRTARKTWRFFETFVTDADHWLPPDNYQEDPKGVVAHRTSPTNVGLLLLSTLSAHDLGYVALPALADRLKRTFDTLDRLERCHGHFLNWYETITRRPLPPAYVSTVDSGNLLGCLLAIKHGLAEKADEPVPSPAAVGGLLDALNLAAESLPAGATGELRARLAAPPSDDLLAWDGWLATAGEIASHLPTPAVDGVYWVGAVVRQLRELREELAAVCPWLPALRAAPAAVNGDERWRAVAAELNTPAGVGRWADRLPALRAELAGWAKGAPAAGREAVAEALTAAIDRSRAGELLHALSELARRAVGFADAMDFRFLYDGPRHLFAIGYNVPHERLDPAHYDLLASEACLASFLAVARGVVPRKHWFQLGRMTTRAAGRPGLLSWGGTMFEYLMPRLLLPPTAGTLLDVAQRTAVARHVEYGRQKRVPWGVSESGFFVTDATGDYQYQSFGVPGLGLKRGLAKDLVSAPYATLLAVQVDAAAAVANFGALRAVGAEGRFGFYEAVDFTPDRVPPGKRCGVVKSYMAHHQGMGLCAITNRLRGDIHCRRLRAEPAVRAVELLLQERVPTDAPEVRPAESDAAATGGPGPDPAVSRRLTRADTPAPRSHLLSNGHYTVLVTNAGGGFSTCRGLAVTRWRNDPTRDHYGSFLYVRDPETGAAWSAGHQPMTGPTDAYEVVFSADKAEIRRRDGGVETYLEVAVAPDRDVEVRRLTLVNHGEGPRTLEVTSYAEVVLTDPRADLAHPAFGKLFLETEWLPQWDALVCRRRPRSADQRPVFAVHVVAADPAAVGPVEYETDRAKFLGRRRTPADPEALDRPLSGTVGPVLDPVFALRRTVRVAPGAAASLAFATAVTDTREEALGLADHYHSPAAAARAFELAWAHSRVELRTLGVTAAESHLFQRLAGHVLYPPPALRSVAAIKSNRQGQPGLWRYGISGDLPIVVVAMPDGEGMALARQALKAHAFWRGRGFPVDLVLLCDRPASYREELHEDLTALVRSSDSRGVIDQPGGVFVRKASLLGEEGRALLFAAARVVLYGDRGTLADQTDAVARGRSLPSALAPPRPAEPAAAGRPFVGELLFSNGTGGFTPDGREYVVTAAPPAPWANVIANPTAGCLTTDSGLGYTWVGNSQSNRLTPWGNDPVSDPPAEAVYLRDEETGEVWSPTPLPAGRDAPTAVWHGAGYTSYAQERAGLGTELTAFVPVADPVKLVRLKVHNRGDRPRRLSAAFFAELVLGTTRDQTASFVVTEVDPGSGALLAQNAYDPDFGTAVAFADTSLRPRTLTGDRAEFLGRNHSPSDPAALRRTGLSGATGPALDPCAALHGRFEVRPGQSASVVFVLGQATDAAAAPRLAARYRDPAAAEEALHEVIAAWDRRLSAVRVRTPDPALDVLVNRWLPYQVLACRVWGRSAFYQSGGAYGFRDQLQDVLALLYAEPAEARAHILRAAARQFPEGDVQHWWHPPSGRGVRTRFSDDFLWLPYAAARYAAVTGDAGVFDEPVRYIRGPAQTPEEHESYFLPDESAEAEPLYRHCLRALDHGWALGPHGLPLMGCGDWNDGMNLVGAGGKGESVWVAWFQVLVRTEFAAVAEARGDADAVTRLRAQVEQLRAAVEAHAWDGDWYLRAWFDDGTPLGSHANDECRIDSLPQSWAVLSGSDDPARAARAVDAAVEHLVDGKDRLVKLFEPPFDAGPLQPGYIKGYVPGIRENGGQYTHAAVWLVQALAGLGRGSQACALWRQLCPVGYAETADGVARYRVEPYVVAADVYAVPPHVGRGGWTWYTGSAAWLYRVAVEALLGLTRHGDRLAFDPRIPAGWSGYEVEYRHGEATFRVRVENPAGVELGVAEVWLDGARHPDRWVTLQPAGEHEVRVVLGPG
jgi:cyclic beta-1,2-glucan synthetase